MIATASLLLIASLMNSRSFQLRRTFAQCIGDKFVFKCWDLPTNPTWHDSKANWSRMYVNHELHDCPKSLCRHFTSLSSVQKIKFFGAPHIFGSMNQRSEFFSQRFNNIRDRIVELKTNGNGLQNTTHAKHSGDEWVTKASMTLSSRWILLFTIFLRFKKPCAVSFPSDNRSFPFVYLMMQFNAIRLKQ